MSEETIQESLLRGRIQPRLKNMEDKGILVSRDMGVNHKTGLRNAIYEIADCYKWTCETKDGQQSLWNVG